MTGGVVLLVVAGVIREAGMALAADDCWGLKKGKNKRRDGDLSITNS